MVSHHLVRSHSSIMNLLSRIYRLVPDRDFILIILHTV
nr:MAG TPA: hypothetical protein [Caudoviricetes sp.]